MAPKILKTDNGLSSSSSTTAAAKLPPVRRVMFTSGRRPSIHKDALYPLRERSGLDLTAPVDLPPINESDVSTPPPDVFVFGNPQNENHGFRFTASLSNVFSKIKRVFGFN